jgi:hypothetical protein
MIIDGDVKIFPAGVMSSAAATVGTNLDVRETAQLFDIEMQQIAGSGMLVADEWDSGLQIAHAIQTQTAEDAADSSAATTSESCNVQAGEALAA